MEVVNEASQRGKVIFSSFVRGPW